MAVTGPKAIQEFSVWRGGLTAGPIVLVYLPVGFALGVLGSRLQFSLGENFFLSASSFSGSGQSVAIQSLLLSQPVLSIWMVTIILNLRYFLMSSVLVPYLDPWPKPLRYLFSLFVTDEIFAVHSAQFREQVPPIPYVFAVNITAWAAWILGGVLGLLAGDFVSDVRPYGFDFAVAGMFIALIVLQIENKLMALLGVLGAALGILLALSPLKDWSVLLSGALSASLGLGIHKCRRG